MHINNTPDPAGNMSGTRTLGKPVGRTIFHGMGPDSRASMGIAESLIRVSVGIEDNEDHLEDFKQALG